MLSGLASGSQVSWLFVSVVEQSCARASAKRATRSACGSGLSPLFHQLHVPNAIQTLDLVKAHAVRNRSLSVEFFGRFRAKVFNLFMLILMFLRDSFLSRALTISASYLRDGDSREIYLDIIHELVHVKQFRNGIELHDNRFGYTNRPTEIEAYAHAVKEARRIGMTEKEIYEYLWMERMSEEEVKNLASTLNVKP